MKERAKPPTPEESNNSSHRMQILMSEASAEKLTALRDMLEASSYGEVVRRALQYYEKLLPCLEVTLFPQENSEEGGRLKARVQILLPLKTLERLEVLKTATPGASYGEIIRTALTVYRKACLALNQGEPFVIHRENGDTITVPSADVAA